MHLSGLGYTKAFFFVFKIKFGFIKVGLGVSWVVGRGGVSLGGAGINTHNKTLKTQMVS
jgi:hypothetical protein